jgi:hypothetical protein
LDDVCFAGENTIKIPRLGGGENKMIDLYQCLFDKAIDNLIDL